MAKQLKGEVGLRKVNAGGYVWWKGDMFTVATDTQNLLAPTVGRTVHVLETGGQVYIGIGGDYDQAAELHPAQACKVNAEVTVVNDAN
ncbi:MAG: hypothetical protein AAF267_01420 [Deinococcota bacterium]